MIKRRLFKTFGLIATLALALVLSACGNGGASDDKATSLGIKMLKSLISRLTIRHHAHLSLLKC